MASLFEDFYVRVSSAELQKITLVHLCSGLDEDCSHLSGSTDRICEISGYTEWVSRSEPIISIGWDWRLMNDGRPRYKRTGEPRSNVMVLDGSRNDLGPVTSSALVASIIDGLSWQEETAKAILDRYA